MIKICQYHLLLEVIKNESENIEGIEGRPFSNERSIKYSDYQIWNDVEPNFWTIILQLAQEHRKQVLDGAEREKGINDD